jgi:hypothetical protein
MVSPQGQPGPAGATVAAGAAGQVVLVIQTMTIKLAAIIIYYNDI